MITGKKKEQTASPEDAECHMNFIEIDARHIVYQQKGPPTQQTLTLKP